MKTIKKTLSILLVLATLLSISAVSTLSVSAASYSESESNDSYSTADTLNLDSTIKGALNNSQDVDIFVVRTSSNGKLSLTFNHEYTDKGGTVGWIVTIYCYADGKYNELSEKIVSGNDDEIINLPSVGTVASGVYYIKIDSIWADTPYYDYSIKCVFAKSDYYEKEMNNAYNTATVIYANHEYNGYISGSNDVDVYKIIPSKAGKITPVFKHVSEESAQKTTWIVTIYQYADGKYNEISKNYPSLNVGESTELPSFNAVANGVYYIKVDSIWTDTEKHEYGITAKSSTEPSADIGTGGNDTGNSDVDTDAGFSFMDVLNAVLNFFKWLFNAVLALFS